MRSVIVKWDIGVDGAVGPKVPLPEIPETPRGALLVIGGRAPVWLYGRAIHAVHGSLAGAIATYDPRLGAVVIASRSPLWWVGDVVEMEWQEAG